MSLALYIEFKLSKVLKVILYNCLYCCCMLKIMCRHDVIVTMHLLPTRNTHKHTQQKQQHRTKQVYFLDSLIFMCVSFCVYVFVRVFWHWPWNPWERMSSLQLLKFLLLIRAADANGLPQSYMQEVIQLRFLGVSIVRR